MELVIIINTTKPCYLYIKLQSDDPGSDVTVHSAAAISKNVTNTKMMNRIMTNDTMMMVNTNIMMIMNIIKMICI
jgi:hypothetical protein